MIDRPTFLKRNEVFRISDEIAAGGPCPSCSADWKDAPELGNGARELTHAEGCFYLVWLDYWIHRDEHSMGEGPMPRLPGRQG